MTHILIVDDQLIVRTGLRSLLAAEPDFEIVGDASNGSEALEKVEELAPDVVLMDLRMPGMDGVAATASIACNHPSICVIALTSFDDDQSIDEALAAGARGYLVKDVGSATVAAAIRSAIAGITPLGAGVLEKVRDKRPLPAAETASDTAFERTFQELGELDRRILCEIGHGCSNREIGQKLFLSEGTVKNRVSAILLRLKLRDRTQAAIAMQPVLRRLESAQSDQA